MASELLLVTLPLLQFVSSYSLPHVAANFQDSPQPFELQVDPDFMEDVVSRVADARAPIPIEDAPSDGPPLANFTTIQDYWMNQYNWNRTQASINEE